MGDSDNDDDSNNVFFIIINYNNIELNDHHEIPNLKRTQDAPSKPAASRR